MSDHKPVEPGPKLVLKRKSDRARTTLGEGCCPKISAAFGGSVLMKTSGIPSIFSQFLEVSDLDLRKSRRGNSERFSRGSILVSVYWLERVRRPRGVEGSKFLRMSAIGR